MNEYIFLIIWVTILILISLKIPQREVEVCGVIEKRHSFVYVFVAILPIIICAGTRNLNMGDTLSYRMAFSDIQLNYSSFIDTITKQKGPAYQVLVYIIKFLIGNNPDLYIFIIAAIEGLLLARFFQMFSINSMISIFIFVASCDYASWMENGIRQFLAVLVIANAFSLLLSKKYFKFFLVVAFCGLIHASSLIMIPIFIICLGKAFDKKIIISLIVTAILLLFIGEFTNILDGALADTEYHNVVLNWTSIENAGTNPLRALFYSIPALIALFWRWFSKTSVDEFPKHINILFNLSFFVMMLYVISVFTSGIYIGRLPIYCSIFAMEILLPWEMENIIDVSTRVIGKLVFWLVFILFFYFQMGVTWGLI